MHEFNSCCYVVKKVILNIYRKPRVGYAAGHKVLSPQRTPAIPLISLTQPDKRLDIGQTTREISFSGSNIKAHTHVPFYGKTLFPFN